MTFENLNPNTVELLRKHNLLRAAVRGEILSSVLETVTLEEEEYKLRLEKYLKQNGIESEPDLDKHLKIIGLDHESLKWQIELPLKIQRYSKKEFSHKAEARFLSKKESLDSVIYSLIRVRDGFLARELYLRISESEDTFESIASEYSEGNESKSKGLVGPMPIDKAHPILSEKLRTSQIGQLLEPFCIDDWWIIVRLESLETAEFDDSTAACMANELFQEWVEGEVICRLLEI